MKYNIGGPFSRIEFLKINLNSHQQVKDFLFTQGWVPTTWNYNKETKERTSPKLTEDSFGSIKGELGQLFARRAVLRHRRNSISNFDDPENKGLLSLVREDGRVPAQADTLQTNTARYGHRGAYCNLPGNDAVLGTEVRRCYRASEDRVLVGCDLSGIEMRMAAHFAYKYDQGKLMDMVLNGDFHKEQADNVYGCSRALGKSVTYGILYGAGATKAAAILGCSVSKGQKLIDLFWDFNEGLGKLKKTLERVHKSNGDYIPNIDGRRTYVRAAYRLLNTLLQSSSAIIFKRWMVLTHLGITKFNINTNQLAAYHDDVLHDCCPDEVVMLSSVLQEAIVKTRNYYNIVPELAIDTMVGNTLDEVH